MSDFGGKNDIGRGAFRVGILGCGRATEGAHLPALRSLGDMAEIVAIADMDEHRRRRVGGMFDVPKTFADLDSMLRGAEIDAVAICTPAHSHADAVIAALAAHKHVLVEKPLTLTLDDADRIAAAADASDRKVMLGFNLRHHKLVRQARQMIADGVLGELQLVRTLWTSGIRSRMKVPAWRDRRENGGGVLFEIATHHIDLVRHLTGSDVAEVFAKARQDETDDQTACLTLRLENGATVTSTFSELSGDANEIELIGSKGRLAFSLYRFDSLAFTPTGRYESSLRSIVKTLKAFPQAWPVLRRGGYFVETYRAEWLAFIDAVQHGHPPAATVKDGIDALKVVLAAGASANSGKPISIADVPRGPLPVAIPNRTPVPAEATAIDDPNRPQLSAVIATRGNYEAIRRTIRYLRAQTVQDQMELVIVHQNTHDLILDEDEMKGFRGHRIISIDPFASVAPANAAGVRAAAAPLVALCEDHAFPEPEWAESLIIAHRGPYAAVGPAVFSANPDTIVSKADMVIGYGPWMEPVKPCEMDNLPGHNSSYKREILLAYGDRLAEMLEAETVLQWDLRRSGQRLYLDPHARLAHTNFAKWGIWNKAQFFAGRVFGGMRAMDWPIWKRVLFTCASPLIPLVRLKRHWAQAGRLTGAQRRGPKLLLALMWALAIDGLGQMTGYAIGPGEEKRRAHEFNRVDNITEQDRRQLAEAEKGITSS